MLDLAWLAGIVDGEGCFCAKRQAKNAMHLRLRIEATSTAMIDRIAEILDAWNVGYRRQRPTMRGKSTRPATRIEVDRKGELLRLLELLEPMVVVKHPELAVAREYLRRAAAVSMYSCEPRDREIPERLSDLKRIA